MTTEDNILDSWGDRYQVLSEKLTALDARLLLDLIDEDLERFVHSLQTFATSDDDLVYCECAPDINPDCSLGDHSAGHLVPAEWRVSAAGDYDDFSYYCTPCKESFAGRPGAAEYLFEVLGDETSRPDEDGEEVC
jgi:hypothetical protein